MVTQSQFHNGGPNGPASWQTIGILVKRGQYDEAETLLTQIGTLPAAQQGEDAMLLQIVHAARLISQACDISRSEASWYQQQANRALSRAQQLTDLLGEMCEVAHEYAEHGYQVGRSQPLSDAGGIPSNGGGNGASGTNLWQRFHHALRRAAGTAQQGNGHNELVAKLPDRKPSRATLVVYCLGQFCVYYNERALINWPGRKNQSVLKYLVLNHMRPVGKEVLMELFWPDSDPDAARNSLNVVIYGLRQTFREADPDFSFILFKDDSYQLNPDLHIWVDVNAFVEHEQAGWRSVRRGEMALAAREFAAADALYQGQLLADDRYEEWIAPQRQTLETSYLNLLDELGRYFTEAKDYGTAAMHCRTMLSIDSCHEGAHRRLMRCYQQQGQYHLALRQFHLCTEVLERELSTSPSPATVTLYNQIAASL
ncbi:MAG: hypothetical protein GYB65_15290 [Chloroflexi bacterium]|nr:hypothetical protein [Chloroflexota bacterium]